jgi:hypothetical protein
MIGCGEARLVKLDPQVGEAPNPKPQTRPGARGRGKPPPVFDILSKVTAMCYLAPLEPFHLAGNFADATHVFWYD